MRRLVGALTTALALVTVSVLPADAVPIIAAGSEFAFTDNRGPNPAGLAEGWKLIIGSTNITPSGGSTSATATHVPTGSGPDFALPFVPAPLFPNQYAVVTPYALQTGQWSLVAVDGSGPSVPRLTHVLDHPQMLPLITGLAASGSLLTPHLTWDAVDPATFPSFCSVGGGLPLFPECVLGHQFFNYQVEVRLVTGTPGNAAPLLFTSPLLLTSPSDSLTPLPTVFDLPPGVLVPNRDYLLGIRLVDSDLEGFLPTRFLTATENRSTAFLAYSTTVVPEPATLMLLGTGAIMMGGYLRQRERRR
jgi:hypothetical protein